jgi:flagellar hook-associated protein 1 FlgK|uniref:Flagellar hook-associated protein 1 n=1 Tax=Acidicaldus sp. TaxID=1872105 RepID=A0A8J4M6P4_9PROT
MGLESALLISGGGINNISAQFALIAHNVANAGTAAYASETLPQQSLTADGVGLGVQTGVATRYVNQQLQSDLWSQNGAVSALQTTQTTLQPVSAALGTPGQSGSLSDLLGSLQNAFSALLGTPDSAALQQQVVTSAQTLASGINALSNSYTSARQSAENDLVSSVGTLNAALSTIGTLNNQIVAATASGQSVADLQNQRDAAMQTVSGLTGAQAIPQSNGSILVATANGLVLPTNSASALSITPATMGPNATYPGSIPGIMMGGVDVTAQLSGSGQIGADIQLRDTTLPTYQGELDEFAQNTASRFSAQGLTLFTNASGAVPTSGGTPPQANYVGFASEIQVNPAILANPALVTDGTNAITGSATGATSFTPNPTTGPAGFTTLISRVLNYTFGADVQAGVAQPASLTTSLGPAGNLSAPYPTPGTISDFAATLVAAQASDINTATTNLAPAQSLQTTLKSAFTSGSGVNIDTEMANMVQLQNAYGANARIMEAVQTMWSDLLNFTSMVG